MNSFLKLLCPNEFVESLSCIDIEALKHRGIQAILLDLDNTLVAWQGYEITPEIAAWVSRAGEEGIRACIVSNTRSSGRLRELASQLGIPCAKKALKPRRGGFREALELLGVDPSRSAVIGDQVFTDILGGNRLGLYTILVRPLYRREFLGTRFSRLFERMLLGFFSRQGMLLQSETDYRTLREQSPESGSQK